MKSPVNLQLIFPIKDAPSASFMSFKASCLCGAGIITESEKQWVDARVHSVLAGETSAAATGQANSLERRMNFDDYLRDEAAKYRQLAEQSEDTLSRHELLELAAICEEVANNIEDSMTAG